MKIHKHIDQIRNDFWCTYICEHCDHETGKSTGYNDAHFHDNVIPAKHCPKCGLNRAGGGEQDNDTNERHN